MNTYQRLCFDIITFEVKPSDQITVQGVFEAISHREYASHAYVFYNLDEQPFEEFEESGRILEIATKYGIGVIVSNKVEDFDEWDEMVSATRTLLDPDKTDTFIRNNFSEPAKTKIVKWQK